MKKLILITLGLGVIAGTIFLLNQSKTPPGAAAQPALEAQTAASSPPSEPLPDKALASPMKPTAEEARSPQPAPAAPASAENAKLPTADSAAAAFAETIGSLLSPQTSFAQKQSLWKQLKDAGQLDQAIAELKQRVASNPNDATIQTTLGEAYLNKFPVKDYNEAGILGLQADQCFTAALTLDPSSWDAQYFKAASMAHWPAEMNKGQEVIQRFTALINQQESGPAQPQFARTYVLLGDQYQKMGNLDYARATWQAGSQLFPSDPGLQQRMANPSAQR